MIRYLILGEINLSTSKMIILRKRDQKVKNITILHFRLLSTMSLSKWKVVSSHKSI